MARKQDTPKREEWKAALVELVKEGDYLRTIVQEVVQQTLEAEMDEALGAEKSERTANRRGYRSGYYQRTLVTRVGKLELRVPQTGKGIFERSCSKGISGARRRWWERWRRCMCKGCPRGR